VRAPTKPALGTAFALVALKDCQREGREPRIESNRKEIIMVAHRFSTVAPFEQLRREISSLLEDFDPMGMRGALFGTPAFPAVNLWDDGEHLYAEAEIPGVTEDNLEILVVGNELTIKGRRTMPEDEKEVSYHRRERGTGEFTRSLTLPVDVETEKVEASLKDGILTLRLPKSVEARPRKIAVKES
jgi:HSP20 family protein